MEEGYMELLLESSIKEYYRKQQLERNSNFQLKGWNKPYAQGRKAGE
jgi:hypothetical protein